MHIREVHSAIFLRFLTHRKVEGKIYSTLTISTQRLLQELGMYPFCRYQVDRFVDLKTESVISGFRDSTSGRKGHAIGESYYC